MKKITTILIQLLLPLFAISQSISSINPSSANAGQTLNVTITGVNTHFSQGSGTSVYFGFNQGSGTTVNSINILSNTALTANVTVPSNTFSGNYGVYVYNAMDGYLSLNPGIYINGVSAPSISSITPNTATAGQTLNVTITGLNTHFTQGSNTSVSFGFMQGSSTTTYANFVSVVNNTSLVANITVPSNTFNGTYPMYVYSSVDGYLTLYNAIQITGSLNPVINSISPSSGNAGQTLTVTITGTNTHFAQGSGTSVNLGYSIYPSSINVVNNSSMQATFSIPSNSVSGDYDVNVYDSYDGNLYLNNGFHVNGVSPSIATVSPNYAAAGQTLTVTITGVNTHFSQASGTSVGFAFLQGSSTTYANFVNITSNNTLEANITIPTSVAVGSYPLYLYNFIDGSLTLQNAINIGTVGVSEVPLANDFMLYPNPSNSYLKINYKVFDANTKLECDIYNLEGKMVLQHNIKSESTELDISTLQRGLYIIEIFDGNKYRKAKFIKE